MDELLKPDGGPFGSIMSDLFRERDGGSRKVWQFCGAPEPPTPRAVQTCDAWSVENLSPAGGTNWQRE